MGENKDVATIKASINEMRESIIATNMESNAGEDTVVTLNNLTPTEQLVANLGVHPESWKPIGFVNEAHYDTLIRNNSLSPKLAQQLEAYKQVASGS